NRGYWHLIDFRSDLTVDVLQRYHINACQLHLVESYRESLVVYQVKIPGFGVCFALEANLDTPTGREHFSAEKNVCVPIFVVRSGDIQTFEASPGLVNEIEVQIGSECVCDAYHKHEEKETEFHEWELLLL